MTEKSFPALRRILEPGRWCKDEFPVVDQARAELKAMDELLEAVEPFKPAKGELEIMQQLGRNDGKPRMVTRFLDKPITDHDVIHLINALAACLPKGASRETK